MKSYTKDMHVNPDYSDLADFIYDIPEKPNQKWLCRFMEDSSVCYACLCIAVYTFVSTFGLIPMYY